MKILLLLPWEKDYVAYRDKFSNLLTYAPITLVTLAGLVPRGLNADVEICDEMVQKFSYDKRYDIVAISFVTPSSRRAYEIAENFRQRGSYIVFGGYHTTFMPEEARKHADTIIIGQAEKAFPQFLSDYVKGRPERQYEMPCDMSADYRIPRRDLLPKRGYLNIPCVVANSGCRNKCDFCAMGAANPPNARGVSGVVDEIKSLGSKRIVFFDPNFFQDKQYALELMAGLERLKIGWGCNATTQMAFDEELVCAAQRSGCGGVLFGLESLDGKTMKSIKKGFNDPAKYKQAVEIMQDHNISVNGCFVLGFDNDTKESLLTLPEQTEYLGLNLVRYAILTPVPGSDFFRRLDGEGRIITTDWTMYTQNRAVFRPQNMSARELEETYRRVWKESYKMQKILKRLRGSPWVNKPLLLGANLGFKYVSTNLER